MGAATAVRAYHSVFLGFKFSNTGRHLHSSAGDANLSQFYEECYGLEDANADQVEDSPEGSAAAATHGILPTVFEADVNDDGGEWRPASKHGSKAARAASIASEER